MSAAKETTLDLAEIRARNVAHADNSIIQITNRGEMDEERAEGERVAAEIRAALDSYLAGFAAPQPKDGKPNMITGRLACLGCGSPLDGFLGTFTYGIVHGEGACSLCGYPARRNHYIQDERGEDLLTFEAILQYHPKVLEAREDG